MARSATQTQKPNYKDVEFTGKEFIYNVRIWLKTNRGDRVDTTPITITLNDVISIKGCKLVQSDSKSWISFPQYMDKDGQYTSYIYVDKEFSQAEMDKLAVEVEKALKETCA